MTTRRWWFLAACALWIPAILPACAAVVHVDAGAPGPLHNGESWETAFLTVQEGVDAAWSQGGAQVWVVQGVYTENVLLRSGVELYGGFAGGEAALEDRDSAAHETVLQAAADGSVVTAQDGALLDGFTITGGTGTPGDGGLTFGGAVYCNRTAPIIRNNVMTGNLATHGGGVACWLPGADAWIEGNVIRENEVVFDGGAVYCYRSSPTVLNNTLVCNRGRYGGAIDADWATSPRIEGNLIAGNFSGDYGGGITTYWSWPLIIRNRFIDNECGIAGGGVFAYNEDFAIAGNLFVGNRAQYGGAVASKNHVGSIVSNTMVGNRAAYGGGIASCFGGDPTVINNIIVANQADVGGGIWADVDASAVSASNCMWGNVGGDYSNVEPGLSDLMVDPSFVDPVGLDFHLRLDSPCVDAGDDAAPGLLALDLDGGDRILDGDGDTVPVVDIGAFEVRPPDRRWAIAPDGFFNPGWVWFSIPLDPWRCASSEAGDLLGFDPTNRLFAWDEIAKNLMLYPDDFRALSPGRSYALFVSIGEGYEPAYDGVDPAEIHVRHLPEAGVAWVGSPGLADIEIESAQVRRDGTGEVRSAPEDYAAPDPWLSWYWVYWDPYVDTAMLCAPDPFGDTHLLRAWYGYRVFAFERDLTVLFPKD